MSEVVKRCAACGKENPVSAMKTCMHSQMHYYVCDSKCMDDFYSPPKKPTERELRIKAETERDAALAELAALKGGQEVVAMIRYARGVPGFENEMPHVVSCNDLPDGLYPVYLAQPAQASAWVAGVEAVAKLIEKKADDYAMEYGHDDMGGLSFGSGQHAQAKADYHGSLIELAEEVRAMLAAAPTPGASDGKANEP